MMHHDEFTLLSEFPRDKGMDPFVAKVPTMQMDTVLQGFKQVE